MKRSPLKIVVGVEAQVIVESFLIASVTTFHLAVMPRRLGTVLLVYNPILFAEEVEYMNTPHLLSVAKLCSVICLDRMRRIAICYWLWRQ